ncbi:MULTISPECIES: portal protein [unclassified Bradyrhizobium]|uniref:portal protein n=1 Tax=unclassified Bradyrhizobium TaxID=2631580 RepID=UPI00247985AB|nr:MULTISPECIES: portal protein [unclassified Bradyrhizobium]WGR74334.1 portal protein [Bradyrhizobium sp. ISRA426]WGR79169.1 portal protein [Bradyrhizobium sp. ISRA430]WGR90590.1 portal protein [Bradyrhizobium sp. ISRA432]
MAEEQNPLERQAVQRLAAARAWKSYWELDFKEAYFFAAPHRQRTISSMTEPAQQRLLDAPELNTDEAFILCGDFITEIVNAFMPEAKPWCERGPGMDLPKDVWKQVEKAVREGDQAIFGAMKASNLYSEVAKAFNPDLAIGTVGMWIDRPHPAFPIVNSAIPLRELEINIGPYGDIDDRFAVRYTRNAYVRELVGEEIWGKIDEKFKKAIEAKPTVRTQVIWGFWRKWQEHSDECWQHVVLVGSTLVHDVEIKGEGCCPLWVGRFNPSPDWPWGLGPLIQGLPTLRQIDEMEMALQDHFDLSLRPPTTFPSESFTNVEQGLEPGFAYPIQPGHEGAVKKIYDVPPAQEGVYTYQDKLQKLRKLFYVDMPEQTGDTPPTLGQWLDEMARAQRRIGTPGMPFWRDLSNIFLRYKYLLEKAGAIKPIKVNGTAVALMPRNPAQAAAEQQELAEAARTAQILGAMFPEEFKMNVDGRKTIEEWIKKSRTSGLLQLRGKEDIANAVDQMAKLVGGRHTAGVDESATPGPTA